MALFSFRILYTFSFLFASKFSWAQLAEPIGKGLQYWSNNYPQEKVYLQVDKKQVIAGGDIWFKAWCTYDNKPTFLSKILYADLVDESGSVLQKKMFRIDSSGAIDGFFNIDKNTKGGNYRLNAYTLWMLNFPDFISKQNIFIYGAGYINKVGGKTSSIKLKMNFFPEGGELITGVKNRVAFKITDSEGVPMNVSGRIADANSNSIMPFASEHDGMGLFEIEPVAGAIYKAEIKLPNGALYFFDLPKSKEEGVNLIVQNTKNRIFVMVNRGGFNKEKYNSLLMAAHINGKLVYAGNFNFNEDRTAAAIPKKGLPPGIIHITVFDSLLKPIAERVAFVENYTLVKPNITITKKDVQKRGQNTIGFRLDSVMGENISVLVKSCTALGQPNVEDNIAATLLLTSDLKGRVTNSAYYFANKADSTLKHLDILMMTHGWRRFEWSNVLTEKEIPLKFPIESNISIKGKVTKSDRLEAVKNGKVAFVIKGEDSTHILADAYLTDKGEFIADSINFIKKATVFYEAQNNTQQKEIVDVTIYKAFIDTLKSSAFLPDENLDTINIRDGNSMIAQSIYKHLTAFDTLGIGYTNLAGVTVKAKKLSRIDSLQREYVSPAFEYSDNSIDFTNAVGMQNIWQYLRMQISGFEVDVNNGGGATARFTRHDGIRGLSEDVSGDGIMFMLNEINVSPDFIDNISPDDVALVKVYKGNTAFPWGANQGMIAVYTKKGTDVRKAPYQKVFSKMEIQGYEANRVYFNTDYSKWNNTGNNAIDSRQTLYWNPKPQKGKAGDYAIIFYNNDLGNAYKIVVQGLDKNGRLIFGEALVN